MRVLGVVTAVVLAAAAVAAAVVGARSVPDVQRYLRMRRM
jgi:hypothetical protein